MTSMIFLRSLTMKKTLFRVLILTGLLVLFTALFPISVRTQENPLRPVTVDQPMPDFRLPSYQGPEVILSSLKGKNVMLIFLRGYAAPDRWCTICHYQYAELLELQKSLELQKKYNLEILFVLPYPKETIKQWLEILPAQLDKIKNWKYPENYDQLDEKGRQSVERYRKLFPRDLSFKPDNIPAPFPILIDADHLVSSGLGLFSTNWGGSQVEQNIPAVFIIDDQGFLKFKYLSQNTVDRPSCDYLLKILEMVKQKKL